MTDSVLPDYLISYHPELSVWRLIETETSRSKVITQDDLEGRFEPLAHLFSKAKDIEPRFVGVSTQSVE